LNDVWEERWHPLREEWVVVAAHRQSRPWNGETVTPATRPSVPRYAPDCYLCPGNARVSGAHNPAYEGIHVFDNDHPCVSVGAPPPEPQPAGVFESRRADGVARVVCYTPRHDLSLAELPEADVAALLRAWQQQTRELGARPEVNHVLVFENKGEVVGVSNPHPHGQIYATNFVFKTIETEVRAGARHLAETGRVLFQDLIRAEAQDGRRLLARADGAVAFVPYFARYAYEAYVAPAATHARIDTLSEREVDGLAAVLRRVLIQYDNMWRMSFPYVLALHQAPTDGDDHRGFHFHIELHPPLRRPNLLKYLAGPEIGGGNFLADTSPEAKAAELRAQPAEHYTRAAAAPAAAAPTG
jgi:UDPglucose--hexose-1-phosphate uridylyltransferase